jgi:Na+-driven multidrug efflux pump
MEITDLIAVSDRPGAEFINDAETVRYGTMFLRARCFATPLMFLCFSMVHFTQAIGRGRDSFLLAVIRQLVFNIPLLFLFNHLFGVRGIEMAQPCSDVLTALTSIPFVVWFFHHLPAEEHVSEQ